MHGRIIGTGYQTQILALCFLASRFASALCEPTEFVQHCFPRWPRSHSAHRLYIAMLKSRSSQSLIIMVCRGRMGPLGILWLQHRKVIISRKSVARLSGKLDSTNQWVERTFPSGFLVMHFGLLWIFFVCTKKRKKETNRKTATTSPSHPLIQNRAN